jgi:hypothetical protein
MGDDTKSNPAQSVRMPTSPDIPHVYFNGFSGALTSGDVEFVLERNGGPVAVLNMSLIFLGLPTRSCFLAPKNCTERYS